MPCTGFDQHRGTGAAGLKPNIPVTFSRLRERFHPQGMGAHCVLVWQ
jgi:hypothetical protein